MESSDREEDRYECYRQRAAYCMCEPIHVWRLRMRIMCEREKKVSDVLADGTLQMRMVCKRNKGVADQVHE